MSAFAGRTTQDVLAERRANVLEQMRCKSADGRDDLQAHIDLIDAELASRRAARTAGGAAVGQRLVGQIAGYDPTELAAAGLGTVDEFVAVEAAQMLEFRVRLEAGAVERAKQCEVLK